MQIEKPRTHPLTYAALVLSVLALLLSMLALMDGDSDGYRAVRVGPNQCVIGEDEEIDTDALYCRTEQVP